MDLSLIGGRFFYEDPVPENKRWLFKYFKNKRQRLFLSYYFEFGELYDEHPFRWHNNFREHAGVDCTRRAIQKWRKKLKRLLYLSEKSKEDFDLDLLYKVKSGKYNFSEEKRNLKKLNND